MSRLIDFKKRKDAIYVDKGNGTEVYYYIFDEYEIHYNKIKPHTIQQWHYHLQIEETIVVTQGQLLCKWLENEQEHQRYVKENELVRVKQSIHTFENDTNNDVEFIVFRFVPDGKNKHEFIMNDKTVIDR